MSSIRVRRLRRDYEKITEELSSSRYVDVQPVSGDPPAKYRVTYRVEGLFWNAGRGDAERRSEHVVEIVLPVGYPREKPKCLALTPVWHPNFSEKAGDYICTDDFWSAGMPLADLIVHIGDMIQYKNYNLRSPLNKEARDWAEKRRSTFPLGRAILRGAPVEGVNQEVAIDLKPAPSTDDFDISIGPARETIRNRIEF